MAEEVILLNLGCGPHRIDGFVNLDKQDGWTFESGLPFADGIVDGVTISHALMYVPLERWGFVFSELARVLKVNGVVRITEDATDDPKSTRYKGFKDAKTLTSYALVSDHLRRAGLMSFWMPPDDSAFRDKSLIQNHHGAPPKVFHIEGLKQ